MRKQRFQFILSVLAIVFFSSCKWGDQHHGSEYSTVNGQHITRNYTDDGRLMSEIIYIDSAKGKFITLKYDSNNVLVDSFACNNFKAEGLRLFRIRDTTIYSEYVHNEENGKEIAYGPHKQLLHEGLFANGNQKGEWRFYHDNGKLSTYEYFASNGNRFFLEKFSSNGDFMNVQGSPLIQVKLFYDTISLGESLTAYYEVANPPYGKIKCYSGDIDKNNKIINLKECPVLSGDKASFYKSEATIIYTPKVKGNNSVGIVWSLVQADSVFLKGEAQINFFVK